MDSCLLVLWCFTSNPSLVGRFVCPVKVDQSTPISLSLSFSLAPAVVDPGEETRNEIEEDEFRFFESRCAAFSDTVMIEQIDLVRERGGGGK